MAAAKRFGTVAGALRCAIVTVEHAGTPNSGTTSMLSGKVAMYASRVSTSFTSVW